MTSTGAMTFAFIQAIEKGQGTTYGSILNAMRSTIRQTNNDLMPGGGPVSTLLTMLLTGGSGVGLRQVSPHTCVAYNFSIKEISGEATHNNGPHLYPIFIIFLENFQIV